MKPEFSVKTLAFAALALGVSLACPVAMTAQTPTTPAPSETPAAGALNSGQSGATPAAEPTLKLSQQKLLESFEPTADEEYQLGPGDQITIDSPGRAEISGKHVIGPDGRVTIHLAGSIKLSDLTREGAADAIAKALKDYYTDVSITVQIDKYSSNSVRVVGYVQHPGEILFDGTPTLLNAIGRAGLITPTVTTNGSSANVGSGVPETCTIYRSNSTAVQVDLRSLLMNGNALADMRLRRNDIVFVPQPSEQFVSVLGEVAKPGTIPLTQGANLTSILAQAGCCGEGAGNSPNIHIIQASTGKDFVVPYKKVMTLAGQQEYTLHSGDVILIPKSGFFKATYFLQRISPVATLVSLAAFVGAG